MSHASYKCINVLNDGSLCPQTATTKTGYCKACDPKLLAAERKKFAKRELAKREKEEQRAEIDKQQLENMITECHTVDELRLLNLKIMQSIVAGHIDPRAGSSIVQLLKHQESLIDRKGEEAGDTKPHERDKAVQMAKEMSSEDMLGLIGDIAHGVKNLIKKAKTEEPTTITIKAENPENVS